jgi:hypothetical protein
MTDPAIVASIDIDSDSLHAAVRAWNRIEDARNDARDARQEAARVESEIEALGVRIENATEDTIWIALRDAARESMAEAAKAEAAIETAFCAVRDAYMAAGNVTNIVWHAKQQASAS